MRISIQETGAECLVLVEGSITEGCHLELARFGALLAPAAKTVRLNCGAIDQMNSRGLREWVRAMIPLGESCQLIFEDCPPAMLGYGLMVPAIFGGGRVQSFLAPFRCRDCRKEMDVRKTSAEVRRDGGLLPFPCSACGHVMSPDIDHGEDLLRLLT